MFNHILLVQALKLLFKFSVNYNKDDLIRFENQINYACTPPLKKKEEEEKKLLHLLIRTLCYIWSFL